MDVSFLQSAPTFVRIADEDVLGMWQVEQRPTPVPAGSYETSPMTASSPMWRSTASRTAEGFVSASPAVSPKKSLVAGQAQAVIAVLRLEGHRVPGNGIPDLVVVADDRGRVPRRLVRVVAIPAGDVGALSGA